MHVDLKLHGKNKVSQYCQQTPVGFPALVQTFVLQSPKLFMSGWTWALREEIIATTIQKKLDAMVLFDINFTETPHQCHIRIQMAPEGCFVTFEADSRSR